MTVSLTMKNSTVTMMMMMPHLLTTTVGLPSHDSFLDSNGNVLDDTFCGLNCFDNVNWKTLGIESLADDDPNFIFVDAML